MQHVQVLQQVHQTYSQVKLWQLDMQWVFQQLKQPQRKQDKVEDNILSMVLPLVTKQKRGIVAKANRIVDGKRNANIPVDMSDHFYDHGNEYCRYLITDPRSDRQGKKRKPFEKLV
jgi:hypothetical protein